MDSVEHKMSKEDQTSIMKSSKPLFKLDEPVSTALNSTTANNFDINDDDSLSFVVLGKDSVEATQASVLASYVDIQQKSMSIVCILQSLFYLILFKFILYKKQE